MGSEGGGIDLNLGIPEPTRSAIRAASPVVRGGGGWSEKEDIEKEKEGVEEGGVSMVIPEEDEKLIMEGDFWERLDWGRG
ncbi:hypothetical protein Hanom_Chr08g00753171 [Helianthus anomalus]